MDKKLRGFACIINNHKFLGTSLKDRDGTDVDCKQLTELFKQLHFKVQVFNDVSAVVSKPLSLFVLSPVARRFL